MNPTYSEINSVGRSWIMRYALALAKETLGFSRGKFPSADVPKMGAMSSGDLMSQSQNDKDKLLEQLRDFLDQTSRQKQLERQAKFFESDKSYSARSKQDASRIRTAIRLMDRVYNDEYELEWVDKLKEEYGSDILDFKFENTGRGDGTSYLKYKYEDLNMRSKMKKELIKESREKQKRAHKLLWDFIEHNIQYWWD
jgi:hypothetical protein